MKKIVIVIGLVLNLWMGGIAQDKAFLAKLEYEMAEESLAARDYNNAWVHANKAIEYLGKSNFKIDFFLLTTIYAQINDSGYPEDYKEKPRIDFYNRSGSFLKTHSNTKNRDQDRLYCHRVFGYAPGIGVRGIDAANDPKGCIVTEAVEGGRAAAAGLQANDIVTRLGYKEILSFDDLSDATFAHRPGEVVEVEYLRNGNVTRTNIKIGKLEL